MKKLLTIILVLKASTVFAHYQHPIPKINDVLLEVSRVKETKALNPDSIKILVWNLHKGADDDFVKDITKLQRNKDITLFQEMLLDDKMMNTFASFKDFGIESATSFFVPPSFYRTGVASGSSVKSIETTFVRTNVLEPVINSPKVTIITRYPIKGTDKILTIANIHAVNFVTPKEFDSEIKRVAEVLKKYPKPIIFTGDFNTWLDEKIYDLDQMRRSLGLKEASFYPDHRMTYNEHYLDHFFYSNDLEVVSSKVEGFYQGSDHKPLEVELEYIGQ
jgi:endonuclease/exonuclease/phosphatase (EEP) superfamily protein YafD